MSKGVQQLARWIIKLGAEARSLHDQVGQLNHDSLERELTRCRQGLQFIYQVAQQNNINLITYYESLADIEARLKAIQNGSRRATPVEKIAIFIDGANLSKACSDWFERDIDYAKLLSHFSRNAVMLRAYYYTGIDSEEDLQSNRFLFWLKRNGYRLRTKQIKTFSDGARKGDLDVDIAVDMLELVDKIDRAILFSGDGDFATLLERVGMKGVRTHVVSYWGRGEGPTARELIDAADVFTDLSEVIDEIARN